MFHTSIPKILRLSLAAAVVIGVVLALRPAPIARAATISVNTTTDELNSDGDCSLREAIRAANLDQTVDACPAGNGADTINLPDGNYSLSIAGTAENAALTGDLDITEDLTLDGAGRANTTIV
ncbi:MAG TPA: CSLREA domain-containing protein, partial [Anaerolineae bacterium]|nr:CSLREA domain-containing protein [Anaerolineae bacterium]